MLFVLCVAGDLGIKDQKHCGGSFNKIGTSHQKQVPIVKEMIIPVIKKPISGQCLSNWHDTGQHSGCQNRSRKTYILSVQENRIPHTPNCFKLFLTNFNFDFVNSALRPIGKGVL